VCYSGNEEKAGDAFFGFRYRTASAEDVMANIFAEDMFEKNGDGPLDTNRTLYVTERKAKKAGKQTGPGLAEDD